MSTAATPFESSISDDGDDDGLEDVVVAEPRGVPLLCAPGLILHGMLAGRPTVEARILKGGILRTAAVVRVDIFAVLNATRTRLVDFCGIEGLRPPQMYDTIGEVLAQLRASDVQTTVEVGPLANPDYLIGFDWARVSIVPDLRVNPMPEPSVLARAHEIRALIRCEGDLTTLASIVSASPVRLGEGAGRCVVSLDLAHTGYAAEERALYELAKSTAFKNGWRLSAHAPQPRRSF